MADSDPSDDRQFRERVIKNAIKRLKPEVEHVLFDGDGVHVYIGPVESDGEQIAERYRLGTVAQQFLAGEFSLEEGEDLPELTLHAPDPEKRPGELSYEEVIEYLADREGDLVTVYSYPTFPGKGEATMLGLQVAVELGEIKPVELALSEFVQEQAAVRICMDTPEGWEDGLVLTREWFRGATLEGRNSSYLRVIVAADTSAPPTHPPVGDEDEDEDRDVFLHQLVGWGFAFDFDGDPPARGRWRAD